MDKFIESSLKIIGDIDKILSNSTDKFLTRKTKSLISESFNNLVSIIDQELKQDDKLNSEINDLVEMRKVFTFDIKEYFREPVYQFDGHEDILISNEFSEEKFQHAKKHMETWAHERKLLEDKILKLKNSRIKIFTESRIDNLQQKLQKGDLYFEKYSQIFEKEAKIQSIDKPSLEKEFHKKLSFVKSQINSVIEEKILNAIKTDSSIVCYDAFFNQNYPSVSLSEGSTEHNKNLYKYFDSSMINKKLSSILKAYNKQKLEALESASSQME